MILQEARGIRQIIVTGVPIALSRLLRFFHRLFEVRMLVEHFFHTFLRRAAGPGLAGCHDLVHQLRQHLDRFCADRRLVKRCKLLNLFVGEVLGINGDRQLASSTPLILPPSFSKNRSTQLGSIVSWREGIDQARPKTGLHAGHHLRRQRIGPGQLHQFADVGFLGRVDFGLCCWSFCVGPADGGAPFCADAQCSASEGRPSSLDFHGFTPDSPNGTPLPSDSRKPF